MATTKQRLSSDDVGIPTDANATMDTATEEQCYFCVIHAEMLYISRKVGAMS
jgi:hypothetical protein